MGNKHAGSSRQTLQYQNSVPANPVAVVAPQVRMNRRCSEFRFKSVEATGNSSCLTKT